MNDQATLLKWALLLPDSANGREACSKLLGAVSQQRLGLTALHQAGLLQPLCAALCSKATSAQQRAVAILLEASRCGPGGEVQLAASRGCCQALLDLLATSMPMHGSVFEGQQDQKQQQFSHQHQQKQDQCEQGHLAGRPPAQGVVGSPSAGASSSAEAAETAATGKGRKSGSVPSKLPVQQPGIAQPQDAQSAQPASWEDAHEAAYAACSLLWRISADPEGRELLMAGTSALVPVMLVILGTPSVTLRMAASGALGNLVQAPRVQAQMVSRAQELVPILVGLLSRAGADMQTAVVGSSGGGGSSGLAPAPNLAEAESTSASGMVSPEASPRHPALLAAAPSSASLFGSQVHPGRRGSVAIFQDALFQQQQQHQQQPFLHQKMLAHVVGGGSQGAAGSWWAGAAGWSSQPASPFKPNTQKGSAAVVSHAETVASTLAHVAGLLRVLCCAPAVAAAMVAHNGQPLRRLLRALAQVGCTAASVARLQLTQQQPQQQQQPLIESLALFQLLCGGAVAAIAGHPPASQLQPATPGNSSSMGAGGLAAAAATGGAAPCPAEGLLAADAAPAIMSGLYDYCTEADECSLISLAANPGVATALALSLHYGATTLGAEVSLPMAHPHSQSWPSCPPGPSGPGGTAGAVGAESAGSAGGAGPAVSGALPVLSRGPSGVLAAAASVPLDAAASLRASVVALHILRLVASSSASAAEALVAADCGALSVLRTLSYFLLHRRMQQSMPLDEEAFAMQALASGTLARLAERPAARAVPAMREGLGPPLEVLSALALLLLLPRGAPPPLVWGPGAGESASAAGRSFVASLLAAIAQYGPYSTDVFTQLLVNTRGALGAIISLLPGPTAPLPTARGLYLHLDRDRDRDPQLQSQQRAVPTSADRLVAPAHGSGTAASTAPGGTPSQLLSESGVVAPGGGGANSGEGSAREPYEDAAAAGVEAALALCRVAAHSRDVARVLAAKTTLVPTLLAILRDRRAVLSPSNAPFGAGWLWLGKIRVEVLKLFGTLTTQLGESSVRSDLVADGGLVPSLVHCMGPQQPPEVVAAALEWVALLLGHPAFVQDRMQGATVNDFLGRILELLQLLPLASATAAGALTPLRAASLSTLMSVSGGTTPAAGGGAVNGSTAGSAAPLASELADAVTAAAAAASASPSTARSNSRAIGGSSGEGPRLGSAVRGPASGRHAGRRAEGGFGNDGGSGSLNSSLRGNAGLAGSAPRAAAGHPQQGDWSAGNATVAAAAAVALHRLLVFHPTLRHRVCAIPGLVAALLRQVHGLLDQLAADGYVLPAVTATRLSALLAVLCVLAESSAPAGPDAPLRGMQRMLSVMGAGSISISTSQGRHQLKRFSSTASNTSVATTASGPPPATAGAMGGPGAPAPVTAPGLAPVATAGLRTSSAAPGSILNIAPLAGDTAADVESSGGFTDALRQMLDAPFSLEVLCEAIDAMHAVHEAEERLRHGRSAGALVGSGAAAGGPGGSGVQGGGGGGGTAAGRQPCAAFLGGAAATASGESPSTTDASHASPSRILLTSARAGAHFSAAGHGTPQWDGPSVWASSGGSGAPAGAGPGSPWAIRDGSPGTAGPISPTKRAPPSEGASSAPASVPPIERATSGQVADIRAHALGALQRLVGFWSMAARTEAELADALPGLLAELEMELEVPDTASRAPLASAGGSQRATMAVPNSPEVLRLDAAGCSNWVAPTRPAVRTSRPSRLAASLPPLPPPLPPQLGEVVMLSYGGARRGTAAAGDAQGPRQPHTALLRRVVQVCCKLMVPPEPSRLRNAATLIVATVMSLSDELAAVLALTLPQLLDRLLDVVGLLAGGEGPSSREEIRAAAAGGMPFSAGATMSAAGVSAGVMGLDKQAAGGLGGLGDGGRVSVEGMVVELQDLLQLDAEASLVALDVLLQLSQNGWAKSRLASHPRLAEALDLLLAEESLGTLRTLLEAGAQRQTQQGATQSSGLQHQQQQPPHGHPQQQHGGGGDGGGDAGGKGGGDALPSSRGETRNTLGVGASTRGLTGSGTTAPSLASTSSVSAGGVTDVRTVVAQLIVELAPRTSRSLLPPPGTGNGGLLRALDALLHEGDRGPHGLAMGALWALVASPGGPVAVGASAVPRSLVALLRQQGPGQTAADTAVKAQAVGLLAALVQRLDGVAGRSLGAVEGLAAALLEVMSNTADLLARSVRHSNGSSGAVTGSGQQRSTSAGVAAFDGANGSLFAISNGDLPDVALLEQAAHQLLWSVVAVAGLSRSAAVAARFASLKLLQPTLLAALKVRPLDIQLYTAALVGNLAGHNATAAIISGVRGVGRELVRQLRDTSMDPDNPHLEPLLAAIRNLASSERGRQELASDPATVPCLVRALLVGGKGGPSGEAPQPPQPPQPPHGSNTSRMLSVQLAAAAALANLAGDRCGLEAMVADQDKLLPPLWALARSLVVAQAPGGLGYGAGGEWVLNRRVDSRLRLFTCILLASTLGHPVLARTSLTLHDAVANLMAIVLALPSPSRHAAREDPLAPLRPRRQRMAAVAVLDALKQLLVAAGPRALQGLQGRPVKSTAVAAAATAAVAAAATAAVAAAVGGAPPAPAPGAPGSPARLARLVDHVMDLLAWVDFHSAEEVAGDPTNAGMGADVAGAAAGVVGQLAVLGIVGRFPEYAAASCQSLIKLMVLPTLQARPYGQVGSSAPGSGAPAGVLDVAAGHAAAAVWALVSNPLCRVWAQQIRTDAAAQHVMILLVRRGARGGTRARFSTARIFAAASLGQLAVQGSVPAPILGELVSAENGLPGALLDLTTLVLPPTGGTQQPTSGVAGGGGGGLAAPAAAATVGAGHRTRVPGHMGGGGGAFERHPGMNVGMAGGAAGFGNQAAPPGPPGGGGGGGGGGGAAGRHARAKDVDPQEQARAAALAAVGAAGDLRLTLGLQATGALAHLAGEPGGTAALLELPGLLDTTVRILRCPVADVCAVAAMLLSTLSSAGGWRACSAMAHTAGLVESLVNALESRELQVRAYCAVALGNIAVEKPPLLQEELQVSSSDFQADPPVRPAASSAAVDLILASRALPCLVSMLDECSRLLELRWCQYTAQQQQTPAFSVGAASSPEPGGGGGHLHQPNHLPGGAGREALTTGSAPAPLAAVVPAAISSLVVPLATPLVAPLGQQLATPAGGPQPRHPAVGTSTTHQHPRATLSSSLQSHPDTPAAAGARAGAPTGADVSVVSMVDLARDSAQSTAAAAAGKTAGRQEDHFWADLAPSLSAAASAAGALQNLSAGHEAVVAALLQLSPAAAAAGAGAGPDVAGRGDGDGQDSGPGKRRRAQRVDTAGHTTEQSSNPFGVELSFFFTTGVRLMRRCCQLLREHSCLEQLPDGTAENGGVYLHPGPTGSPADSSPTGSPLLLVLRLLLLLLGTLANVSASDEGHTTLLALLAGEVAARPTTGAPDEPAPVARPADGRPSGPSPASNEDACDGDRPPGLALCLVGLLTLPLPRAWLARGQARKSGSQLAQRVRHHENGVMWDLATGDKKAAAHQPGAEEDFLAGAVSDNIGVGEASACAFVVVNALGLCCNLLADDRPAVGGQSAGQLGDEASFWDDAHALEKELAEPPVPSHWPRGADGVLAESPAVAGPDEIRYGSVVFQSNRTGGEARDFDDLDASIAQAWPPTAAAVMGDDGGQAAAEGGGRENPASDAAASQVGVGRGGALAEGEGESDGGGESSRQAAGRQVLCRVLGNSAAVRSLLAHIGGTARGRDQRLLRHLALWLEQRLRAAAT